MDTDPGASSQELGESPRGLAGVRKKRTPKKHISSKYDFVKVRVLLGDHYYILSRFLVSRVLLVTKVRYEDAIKLSLDLKRYLVDNGLLELTHAELEEILLGIMQRYGYGDAHVRRYRMMSWFHHQRVPFIILICGTACIGKSTIANQLAERLNLPSILQTDVVFELMQHIGGPADADDRPLWQREFASRAELLAAYQEHCGRVRQGLEGDLEKCSDGKALIIEGIHLDPSRYTDIVARGSGHERQITIPILLTLGAPDRSLFLENWLLDHLDVTHESSAWLETCARNVGWLQDYLAERASASSDVHVVPINPQSTQATLEQLHDVVLERIERYFDEFGAL